MKNVETLLKEIGADIPQEKKEQFTQSFNTEYKTIADYTKQTEKLSKIIKELEEKNAVINELNEKIKTLSDGTGKLQELEEKVKEYENAEDERIEKEKLEKVENEIKTRFETVTAEKKFKHDLIKSGVYGIFKNALNDEQNKTKGDKELFAELEKDNDWYENPQDPITITSAGSSTSETKATFPNFF